MRDEWADIAIGRLRKAEADPQKGPAWLHRHEVLALLRLIDEHRCDNCGADCSREVVQRSCDECAGLS